jgi:hypothetical protein
MRHPEAPDFVAATQESEMATVRERGDPKDRDRRPRRDEHEDGQRNDAERAPRRGEDDGGGERGKAQHQQPARTTSLLTTAAIALICGVIGAMGYSYFFGSKSDESSAKQANSEAGSNKESSVKSKAGGGSDAESAKESSTQPPGSSSTSGSVSRQDSDDLKQMLRTLNQRIDRVDERVDRLTELLSLAVPLLQRIAPKN